MNCDEYLRSRESGGFVERLLARRHAAHCRRCASVGTRLDRLQLELAEVEPLSSDQRQLWESAADDESIVVVPRRARRSQTTVAIACAASLALAVTIWLVNRPGEPPIGNQITEQPGPTTDDAGATEIAMATPAEVAELKTGLDSLAQDLAQLSKLAALLDARRKVGELAATYRPLKNNGEGGLSGPIARESTAVAVAR